MQKVRVAVVGGGYLGRFHAQKYAALPEVELVGVVDIDPENAKTVADQVNTRAYAHHRELTGRIDAASVVVPTPAHFAVSRDLLSEGIDLLIEKPMTETLAEAEGLIDLAERRGCIIQVGHLERFNPAVMALDGIVHQPRFIESHRLSAYQPRGTDVSVVLDLMIHDIDIISNFVRSEVTSIHAAGIPVISNHVDIANARIAFQNGCVANVTASRISMGPKRKIRLFQGDAYISVDFASREITIIRQSEATADNGPIPGAEVVNRCFTESDALEEEIKAFVHSVGTRKPPQVSGETGRDALKIALSIMDQISDANLQHSRNGA